MSCLPCVTLNGSIYCEDYGQLWHQDTCKKCWFETELFYVSVKRTGVRFTGKLYKPENGKLCVRSVCVAATEDQVRRSLTGGLHRRCAIIFLKKEV